MFPADGIAQSKALQKAAQRYEIDAKRSGVDPTSEDGLPRSREFLRIDSSYYVGWMFEGIYKMDHAADYVGYKNAIAPLEKALYLLERDYGKQLSTRSSNIQVFYPVYNYQVDYGRIGYSLRECYANTEQPEKVVALMRRTLKWKFQREFILDPYNFLAWITHRYRFYTNARYSFLKGSLEENEALAMRYLDSSLQMLARNRKYNDGLFMPGYDVADKMGVYHYKCILYSYALQIDSAEKYFGLMRRNNALPHNNYANFKSVCGDFRQAAKEYSIASGVESGDKRLQEWAYYTSILDIGKAAPKDAVALCNGMIKGYGSTPGFGWYNIALSRALAYDGQLTNANKALEKAAGFKELHIGTTLGQSHYDFSIQLQRLMQKEQEIQLQRFEHKDWWYSPSVLGELGKLSGERLMLQYLIINQFAENPERDRVVYKLFSSESTVGWDEVWFLIKDFSTAFFVKRFEKELKENKRKAVDKYFRLFLAKLKLKQDKTKEAKALLLQILQDQTTDKEYEQLLLARTYEALAQCALKEKEPKAAARWTYELMRSYPQLVPFSGLKAPLRLRISGNDAAAIAALKNCNFDFEAAGSNTCYADIRFYTQNNRKQLQYRLIDAQGRVIVKEQSFSYKDATQAGKDVALRLCNIGGTESAEKAIRKEVKK
ncbi:hypothetical protein GCM10023092_20680 [Rurimicrobium arvi]|uniref:Tetratricopeptide repeat protein n=1 Tax=Rurimicrobium arvi TaxID=2049916 RepID=A0ABP8MWH1_9BACT